MSFLNLRQLNTTLAWLWQCQPAPAPMAAPVLDKNKLWGWKTERSTLEHSTIRCQREKSNSKVCSTSVNKQFISSKATERRCAVEREARKCSQFLYISLSHQSNHIRALEPCLPSVFTSPKLMLTLELPNVLKSSRWKVWALLTAARIRTRI